MSDVFFRTVLMPLKARKVPMWIVGQLVFLLSGLSHEYLFVFGLKCKFGRQLIFFFIQGTLCFLQNIFERKYFKIQYLPWFFRFAWFWLIFG